MINFQLWRLSINVYKQMIFYLHDVPTEGLDFGAHIVNLLYMFDTVLFIRPTALK
jgi:hypothetical protein